MYINIGGRYTYREIDILAALGAYLAPSKRGRGHRLQKLDYFRGFSKIFLTDMDHRGGGCWC